jgi:acyl-CoA reductase-like NAD-dependent aldehyde dehydrogenase
LPESSHSEFVDKLVARLDKMVMGDLLDPETEIGCIARQDLFETLENQVSEGLCYTNGLELDGQEVE